MSALLTSFTEFNGMLCSCDALPLRDIDQRKYEQHRRLHEKRSCWKRPQVDKPADLDHELQVSDQR